MNTNMNKPNTNKAAQIEVPKHLTLTVLLSTSLTIILSVTYGILSLLAIISRSNCNLNLSLDTEPQRYLINMIVSLYIQSENCNNTLSLPDITTPQSVFILSILTLVACVICLIAACSLISVVLSENYMRYINIVANLYVCCCAASFVIDLTFGIHFGLDYSTFNNMMESLPPGDLRIVVPVLGRLGAFLLMALTLKAFLVPVINIALLILLVVYAANFQKHLQTNEHSIHSVGALNAYDQKRRNGNDPWQVQNGSMYLNSSRGPEVNPSYVSDDDLRSRTPVNRREPPMSDYSNRSFERSESWHTPGASGSRPFSYLEEPKRPIPVKPPTSPVVEPQWRREEPQWRKEWSPAVPAPDYSPTSPRRLKSALKPSYM
ncbi:uncharacterized protein LOC113227215 [Hyposmocoma kahamanoa]|uniref:uncharacterized protein LOC113227215 n=1 Tax=Hyposmocoma kahamanoa TaxID=1477025 RepID=UPI000E6D9D61|nr:uncharacterized protein LOC113227215 [Hyposmocoma kahamanoa]